MKNGLHINPLMVRAALLLTCFMLVMIYNKSKAQVPTHYSVEQVINK